MVPSSVTVAAVELPAFNSAFDTGFGEIAPREARHAALGIEGLDQLVATEEGKAEAKAAVAYWRPRVAVTFGVANSARYDTLAKFGLRHATNEDLHARWDALVAETLGPIGLN